MRSRWSRFRRALGVEGLVAERRLVPALRRFPFEATGRDEPNSTSHIFQERGDERRREAEAFGQNEAAAEFRQPPQIVQDERSLKQSRRGRLDPAPIDAPDQEVSVDLVGLGQLLVVRQVLGVVLVDGEAVPRRNRACNGCLARIGRSTDPEDAAPYQSVHPLS
jgi:hypothetical protein